MRRRDGASSYDPLASVCGVLHRITVAELDTLDRTEGVHLEAYERIAVEVTTGDGCLVEAYAYISRRGVEGRKPSARYMGLLLDGAREYGLPVWYVAELEQLELAVDEREQA